MSRTVRGDGDPGRALWSLAGVPLLFAIISLPMALELIGPNPVYGVRTAATLASEEAWYSANRASGIAGVAAGLIGFGVNVRVLRSRAAPLRKIWICLGVLIASAVVMIAPGLIAS